MYVGKIIRERLEEIAGYPLEYRPTNSEFVDMIAFIWEMKKKARFQTWNVRIALLEK